jgi:hypothetical protein
MLAALMMSTVLAGVVFLITYRLRRVWRLLLSIGTFIAVNGGLLALILLSEH